MAASQTTPQQRVLLSTNVSPSHYDLSLDVDLKETTFKGVLTVDINVNTPTSVIELYALELNIPFEAVHFNGIKATLVDSNKEKDGLTKIHFENELPIGQGKLHFAHFDGKMNDNMEGFYRSQYTHSSGEKRYMGVTQFEATDARRAFPCWDEPALKATFTISITADADLVIASNMPETGRKPVEDAPQRVTVSFDKTPIMSTYLLAWMVGEFSSVSGASSSGTKVSVFTPHGKASEGEFALDVACKVLDYFEEYYAIPYQLPKLDMAAIPDFAAGAMENWGLVTYRETALLITANASVAAKQRVAYVVAHELAHQWFGNLVTMQWWRELWLNEGFATYAGQAAIAHIFPQWDMWTAFISDYVAGALRLDGLRSSHPIEVEVYTSSQITEIFDAISYYKGASIIRMLASAIGPDAFRDGLRIYLRRHIFKNAVTTDLWAALSESSGVDVKALMSNWTLAVGYPVLSVSRDPSNPKQLIISQRRFFADGSSSAEDTPMIWKMILKIASYNGSQEVETVTVSLDAQETRVELADAYEWLIVNAGQSTFCRVAYSDDLAKPLSTALAKGQVTSTADRLGIINDAFALARAGATSTSNTLRLVGAFANEPNYQVATIVSAGLSNIKSIWAHEPESKHIRKLIADVFSPALKRLTWERSPNEEDTDALYRALAVSLLIDVDEPSTSKHALSLFHGSKDETSAQTVDRLPPDLRFPIYAAVIKNDGQKGYDAIYDIYKNGISDHGERLKALRALGFSPEKELLIKTLRMSLNSDEVRTQDTYLVFHSVGSNTHAPRLAFDFMKENWSEIQQKIKGALVSRVISSSAGSLLGEAFAVELENFFKENPCPVAERTISQVCEGIRANTQWLTAHRQDVAQYFSSHSSLNEGGDIF